MELVTQNFNEAVEHFMKHHGLHHIIAFSGGASTEIPGIAKEHPLQEQYAQAQHEHELGIVTEILGILRHYRIAVLTGGTHFGLPKIATTVAAQLGFKTIGVFPLTAAEKKQVLPEINLPLCVCPEYGQSCWGDESSVFAKLLHAVIVIGGGAGTLIEISHILKMNEALLKKSLPLKLVVPMYGTGGVADGLPFVWGKQEIKNACMPEKLKHKGEEAARHLQDNLDFFTL